MATPNKAAKSKQKMEKTLKDSQNNLNSSTDDTTTQKASKENDAIATTVDTISQESCVQEGEDNTMSNNNMPARSNEATIKPYKESATQTSEDQIMLTLNELQGSFKKLDKDLNDPRNGVAVQLAKTQEKVGNLYSDIHGAVDGLKIRMDQVTTKAEDNLKKIQSIEGSQARMAKLLDENKRLVNEMKIMQGLVHKVNQQTHYNADQLLDLTKRGMEQNLLLHGVDDQIEKNFFRNKKDGNKEKEFSTVKECCKYSALHFFKDTMKIEVEVEDIWKAHRTGPPKANKVRPLIVKLAYPAKDLVMENMSTLKGKSNPITGQKYFVSEQIPEGLVEMRKQNNEKLKKLKETNEKKPEHQRDKLAVINNKITANGELLIPDISPPLPSQLFPEAGKQMEIDRLQQELVVTEEHVAKNSTFIALAAKVNNLAKVRDLYIATAQRFSSADHIMAAYALKEKGTLKQGAVDDREYGAAAKIQDLIFDRKARDTVIFVVRKYGGLHMGFERFNAITHVAEQALQILAEST